jgi:hypothetical protein
MRTINQRVTEATAKESSSTQQQQHDTTRGKRKKKIKERDSGDGREVL